MKFSLIGTASFLFGASLALVEAQGRPGGPPPGEGHGGPEGKRPPATEIAKNLSTRFEAIAVFDTDKNGKLDATEQTAVAKAITDGTLEVGPPRPPKDDAKPVDAPPPGDKVAEHVAKLYDSLAVYDADKSGKLDETEQAAVVKAIEDGTLKLPRHGSRRGPGGPGGGRSGRGPKPE